MFKIYDETLWSGVFEVYDHRNRQVRGRVWCMMNRNLPMEGGGGFKIYDEPHWSGVLNRNPQMSGHVKKYYEPESAPLG